MLLAVDILAAGDFWTDREAGQWSENEVKRIVTDSPWAQTATVDLQGDAGAIMNSWRHGSAPDAAGAGGDESGGGGGPVLPKIVVRWESAAPICQVCARSGLQKYLFTCTAKLLYLSGLSRKFAELSEEFYIVSISNYPKIVPHGRGQEAPQHSAAANAALEELGQRIRQLTFIRRKGKDPIRPAQVVVLPAGQGLLSIVFFPRTAAITLGDKQVLFESADGMIVVTSKFNLRKMIYKGKLEL
jgi:hypothetical protein